MTSRSFEEADFEKVVDYIDQGVQIAVEAKTRAPSWFCSFFCFKSFVSFVKIKVNNSYLLKILGFKKNHHH